MKDRGRLPEGWLADFEAKSPNPPQEAAAEATKPKRKSKVTTVEAPVFQAI